MWFLETRFTWDCLKSRRTNLANVLIFVVACSVVNITIVYAAVQDVPGWIIAWFAGIYCVNDNKDVAVTRFGIFISYSMVTVAITDESGPEVDRKCAVTSARTSQ